MPIEKLRKNDMMAHLLSSLEAGKDIGHYGRLVFAMVAHYFMSDDEMISYLTKEPGFDEEKARTLQTLIHAMCTRTCSFHGTFTGI